VKDQYYLDPRVAESYDRDQAPLAGDVEFYMRLALEAAARGLPVLELAVGTGRVAIPIAQAGVKVVGLDRSPAMLDVARRKAEGIENLRLVEGDMASFDLWDRFGLIFIPFRSFLHLVTVEDQRSCLECVHRHLVPGGLFALNFFNPDLVMIANWLGQKRDGLQRIRDVSVDGQRHTEWATRRYGTARQQIDEDRIDERLDDRGAVVSRVYRKMALRYVFRYEMQHLLELTGFEVEALYGGFEAQEFVDSSSEMVWVAVKR
jgi:ubiquinone/menaquinone biosynthesis C-methylase UbiE